MAKKPNKRPVSFRLTVKGSQLLDSLAEYYGVSRSAVIEMAIRDKARAEGLEIGPKTKSLRLAESEKEKGVVEHVQDSSVNSST